MNKPRLNPEELTRQGNLQSYSAVNVLGTCVLMPVNEDAVTK